MKIFKSTSVIYLVAWEWLYQHFAEESIAREQSLGRGSHFTEDGTFRAQGFPLPLSIDLVPHNAAGNENEQTPEESDEHGGHIVVPILISCAGTYHHFR